MARFAAAFAALVITGLVLSAAVTGVVWLLNSHSVWAVVRAPWFKPAMIAFNSCWIGVWVSLYIVFSNRKKTEAAEITPWRVPQLRR